ncbi:hypothetical protein VNO77_41112 [Canavalia gladiata]|uniref:Uncharacterized protein n=1 Tax=Canavalia gladiata TaxID=3824 RepID=A0AAN9K1C3_CANGL
MDSISSLQGLNSQVPSSLSVLSCPSGLYPFLINTKPPDVGNWFSSYEYRSPDPDSNFSVEDSAFRGNESQRDDEEEKVRVQGEVVAGDKLIQCSTTYQNGGLCLNKNLQPLSSCSLLSEPTDIGNWFSSYVYESPVSGTSSPLGDEVSEENEGGEERLDFEVVNEHESRSENVHPKGCVEHNSSSNKNTKGDDGAKVKKKLTIAGTSNSEKILGQCMQHKSLQHNVGPTKYEEPLSLNHGSPGCDRERHLMLLDSDTSAMRPPKLLQKSDTGEAKSKCKIQHDMHDLSENLPTSSSARSSTCTNTKENDGFITTRKNRCTRAKDENSWKKPEKILLEHSTNTETVLLACVKPAITKRKALTEATNLQQSNAMVKTGKWQCPQKHKPTVGPAMKQLRLERWVHKI